MSDGIKKNLERFAEERKILQESEAVQDAWARVKEKPVLHNIQNVYTEQHRAAPYWTAHRESFKDAGYSMVIVGLILIIIKLSTAAENIPCA